MNHFYSFFILAWLLAFTSAETGDPEWVTLEEAQALSAEDQKPLFVFVEAEWCGICKRMRREVFPDPEVNLMMSEEYHLVSIDLDSRENILFNGNRITQREFARSMEVIGTPTIIFIDSNGAEAGRHIGFLDTSDFHRLLVYVTSHDFGKVSFEKFETGR